MFHIQRVTFSAFFPTAVLFYILLALVREIKIYVFSKL